MAKKKDNTPEDEDELQEQELSGIDAEFDEELTEAEKFKLEAEARAEVLKAVKLSKAKAFKQAAKQRIQAEMLFRSGKDDKGADLITVSLLLASHPKYIMLDGAVYHSGRKYTVDRGKAAVLLDQMHRGWEQEYARISPEERGNLKRQRNFRMVQNAEGDYRAVQV